MQLWNGTNADNDVDDWLEYEQIKPTKDQKTEMWRKVMANRD